jgi:nickel transport protein
MIYTHHSSRVASAARRQRVGFWLLIYLLGAVPAFTHGAEYELLDGGVLGVRATFDTGQPMANVPVLIFAPGDSQAQLTTTTDSRGVVCFAPDRSGVWVLQIRVEGGHGLRVHLEVDESMLASRARTAGGFSTWQKLMMASCVLWGFLATALFFHRRKGR